MGKRSNIEIFPFSCLSSSTVVLLRWCRKVHVIIFIFIFLQIPAHFPPSRQTENRKQKTGNRRRAQRRRGEARGEARRGAHTWTRYPYLLYLLHLLYLLVLSPSFTMAAVLERQSEASGAQALAQEQAQQGMEDLELAGPIPIQQLQVRPWKQLTNPDPDN